MSNTVKGSIGYRRSLEARLASRTSAVVSIGRLDAGRCSLRWASPFVVASGIAASAARFGPVG